MITASNLHRSYFIGKKSIEILHGVDLHIAAGEKVFLCGPSGAGKTTLVQALAMDAAKAPPGLQGQITAWLKHEDWERVKRQVNGVRAWGFTRPAEWPPKDRVTGLDQRGEEPAEGAEPMPAPAAEQAAPATPVAQFYAQGGMDEPF